MAYSGSILNSGTIEQMIGGIIHLAKCVRDLSILVPSDDNNSCLEFKKKQLYHSLVGDNNDISKLKTSEIASNFLEFSSGSTESHLGVIHVRDIGCHFEHLKYDDVVSVLDLHKNEPTKKDGKRRWCIECPSSANTKPDFKAGIVNPFNCWRRGHSSEKLGFLHISEISAFGTDVSVRLKNVYSSKELQAMSYGRSMEIDIQVGDKIPGNATSMVCVIKLNTDKSRETNRTSEIRSILSSQLLVSKHLNTKNSVSNYETNKGKKLIPEFVKTLLNTLHDKWNLDGPSIDSKGIIGFALINNEDTYVENETFTLMLESFASTNKIWYEKYNIDELAQNVKDHLNLSQVPIPKNSSALCIILDPLIDLGGISVD
jgi:hypothetical protein